MDYFTVMDLADNNAVSKTEVTSFLTAIGSSVSPSALDQLYFFCTSSATATEVTFAQFQCAANVAATNSKNDISILYR